MGLFDQGHVEASVGSSERCDVSTGPSADDRKFGPAANGAHDHESEHQL